tara:strand:- start:64 stop:411 length:348 start_codon:yes stop_codon:yes gene_type:complete
VGHFAEVIGGVVARVIVAEQDFIDKEVLGPKENWIQTSYNTFGGVHSDGGIPLRKNYAGVGYIYDLDKDAFYAPEPYPSWALNETSCQWEPPTPMPVDDNMYTWNESTTSWDLIK